VLAAYLLFDVQRGNQFADTSIRARASIAELGAGFIRPGCVLLTHGMSRVVLALLQRAVASVSTLEFSFSVTHMLDCTRGTAGASVC
jgi:translation initiation factor eIF-2B subunit alpha